MKLSNLGLLAACLATLLGLALLPGTAGAQVDDTADPMEATVAPLPLTSVPLKGDIHANGTAIGSFDFALIWSEEDPSKVQLWAVVNNAPSLVCHGDVFDSPSGEPVFFGETSLMAPAGTCSMSQLPDRSAITMLAASNDGQWAFATLRYEAGVEPAPIFD